MGLFDKFKKKDSEEEKKESFEEKVLNAKYPTESCALCNGQGCEKKWLGQYWHKRCLRLAKNKSRSMI